MINMIVAIDENMGIGLNNSMPWGKSMTSDLQNFKKITADNPVVMGRKTFESIGQLLPGRLNVILTKDVEYTKKLTLKGYKNHVDFIVFHEMKELLAFMDYNNDFDFFIIGGNQLYSYFLESAHVIYMTEIHHEFEVDTYFPLMENNWKESSKDKFLKDEKNPYDYTFLKYENINKLAVVI